MVLMMEPHTTRRCIICLHDVCWKHSILLPGTLPFGQANKGNKLASERSSRILFAVRHRTYVPFVMCTDVSGHMR